MSGYAIPMKVTLPNLPRMLSTKNVSTSSGVITSKLTHEKQGFKFIEIELTMTRQLAQSDQDIYREMSKLLRDTTDYIEKRTSEIFPKG